MSFMQPRVWHATYYIVETSNGTEYIDANLIYGAPSIDKLAPFCAGKIIDEDTTWEERTGWLAQMSAPGYMDQTDVCGYDTEEEALEALLEMYGDQTGDDEYREQWELDIEERLAEIAAGK